MIHYITLTENSGQVLKFLAAAGRRRVSCLRPRSYESLFAARRLPAGHYIFTDHDYLTSYECERAAEIACAIEAGAGGARILNHPARVLERTALLQRLHADGINDFTATRIDTGEVPPAFPVFIRTEDAKNGPETDILHTRADFDAALADYAAAAFPSRDASPSAFVPAPTATDTIASLAPTGSATTSFRCMSSAARIGASSAGSPSTTRPRARRTAPS